MTRARRPPTLHPVAGAWMFVLSVGSIVAGVTLSGIPELLKGILVVNGSAMLFSVGWDVFDTLRQLNERAPYRPGNGGGPDGDGELRLIKDTGDVVEMGPRRAA